MRISISGGGWNALLCLFVELSVAIAARAPAGSQHRQRDRTFVLDSLLKLCECANLGAVHTDNKITLFQAGLLRDVHQPPAKRA